MKRVLTLILAALMILSLFAGCGGEKKEEKLAQKKFDSFAVGYGKADITPDYTTQISLTGNNDDTTRLSTGVLEPLMANCVAFTDTDGTTVLVFGTDLHGTNTGMIEAIRQQITEKTGVPGDHIQFNASHNHCGPAQGANSAVGPIQIYAKLLQERMVEAAVAAMETRKPAKMYTTFTRPEDMVFVRHFLTTEGEYEANGYDNISKNGKQFLGFAEKGDNLLQLVKFTREGEKDIIMMNWQGHPFTNPDGYYTYLCGVSPAVARRVLLEKANTESIYIMGASGDSVQRPARAEKRKFKDYVEYGTELAECIIEAMDTFQEAETGKIYYTYTDTFKVPSGGTAPLKYILSGFGFGDFGYITAPSETFQSNGIHVRDNSPWKYTFYAQISNGGGYGYIPDSLTFDYTNGAYERGPSKTLKGDGEAIAEEQLRILNEMFTQSGQTKKDKDEGYITVEDRISDGQTYTNPNVGGKVTPNKYGYCPITLYMGIAPKTVVAKNEEIAKQIMAKSTMKLLFNYSNLVVGVE
ncbi:MAG: hypothetical protein J6Q92_01675 [Oscillospiraceae bacterium]|nr:hypothetical protein [Oscillospiraceae bacterium]